MWIIYLLACRFVCPGGAPLDELPEYRQQMQGMTSALLIHILQGRADVIDYLLDPELFLIPPTDHDVSQWWQDVGAKN